MLRKGRKSGYVIASASLLEETASYVSTHRRAWVARSARRRGAAEPAELFISSRGTAVSKNRYQQVIHRAGRACGFKATTHLLRATFACMMLARLERLAKEGAAINPLLIVKVLMGHEHIETTDRYLRAIAVDTCALGEVLDSLIAGAAELMVARRARMSRVLPRTTAGAATIAEGIDAPRRVRRTVIDFSTLPLPADVRLRARGCLLEPLRAALSAADPSAVGARQGLRALCRRVGIAPEPGRCSS